MKYLFLLLILLSSCHKKTLHKGIVVGHSFTYGYNMPITQIDPSNNTIRTTYMWIDDSYYLNVKERDTIYTTQVDPSFYDNTKEGDSISYMR